MEKPRLSVSQFVAVTNQTLEYAYPEVVIEGEVASFKVNQGKFVFFDLKDSEATIGCFMMLFSLRVPIEDGMKVLVVASPKLTQWGKFSLTVKSIRPSGEGAIKKSFELLKAKLTKEGLFALERKRPLPARPERVAVISSTQAAGYADFIKIINDRWGGLNIEVAHVQVQGETAPSQIIRALEYFNTREELPEVIVLIRGGGSADDLAAFNDEPLVRSIAASRVPVLTGIGHEVDESLADLVADVKAATPSNAAQLLVPDRRDIMAGNKRRLVSAGSLAVREIDGWLRDIESRRLMALDAALGGVSDTGQALELKKRQLAGYDPAAVLQRGYAILRGQIQSGAEVELETAKFMIKAEVKSYDKK